MQSLDLRILETAAARLGDPIAPDDAFADAWRQLHYAAQAAAEVGKSWATPQPDDSHSAFAWRDGLLVGARVPAARPFCAALNVRDLALRLVADDGAVLAARTLVGGTLAEATGWVRAQAALLAGDARQPAIPAPDLPAHPIAAGARFELRDRDAAGALARLLGGADTVLREIAAALPGASPVRVWPHHFDMATLIAVAPDATIGAGLAVPDALEPGGYWYVSPWRERAPAAGRWPPLAHGRFLERDGGLPIALLPLADLARARGPNEQARAVARFFADAIARCTEALRA